MPSNKNLTELFTTSFTDENGDNHSLEVQLLDGHYNCLIDGSKSITITTDGLTWTDVSGQDEQRPFLLGSIIETHLKAIGI